MIFGKRPPEYGEETINMQVLDKQRVYLERLENFPLKKAEYYQELQTTTGIKSVRGLSEITGEDWSYIAKVLRMLQLPTAIQDFLKVHQEPFIVKHFNLRHLLEVIQLEDEENQFTCFREMLEKISVEASFFPRPTSKVVHSTPP